MKLLSEKLERVEGIEPSSTAWKAVIIAIIRHPQGAYRAGAAHDPFKCASPIAFGASSENRTRIFCLASRYNNLYTTPAYSGPDVNRTRDPYLARVVLSLAELQAHNQYKRIELSASVWKTNMLPLHQYWIYLTRCRIRTYSRQIRNLLHFRYAKRALSIKNYKRMIIIIKLLCCFFNRII